MIRRPPRSTRTDTLFPYTTLFRSERLRFDYQKTLAARLGYADDDRNLGVEQMMQVFYRAAAIVRRVNDRLLQRFEEHFDGTATPEPLDARFELRRGYLAARDQDWPHGDAAQVFELFATSLGSASGRERVCQYE